MLINSKILRKYKLHGIDGEVGGVKEFFFDDKFWTVRYLIAGTGSWLSQRQVLISPYLLSSIDHDNRIIHLDLTKAEIEKSPSIEQEKPVSRQFEESYHSFFGAPVYWGGPSVWGPLPTITKNRDEWKSVQLQEGRWDPNLRSSKDVSGHNIHASDGELGHVDEFIIDDDTWTIRYLVIDTQNWLPGKKVLISPEWINRLSWEDAAVYVNLTRDAIRNAPGYDPDNDITRDYESDLYHYYNRRGYWSEEPITTGYPGSGYSNPGHPGRI